MIAPPPPPAGPRPVAFYDTECFPNYWLLKFRPRGQAVYTFRLLAGQSFSVTDAARIRLLFEAFCTVSFNGNYYDVPMISAALAGYTAEQLKWLNDRIIPPQVKGQPKVQGAKPWELGLPEWRPADHVDIMEVIPGAGGQKLFAGRIHYKTMRDLPYPPSTYVTAEQQTVVDEYCENDLGQLEALFDAVSPQVKLRARYGARYGLDLRSKSDAQMAEAVLKRRCEQASGQQIYKPFIDWNFSFRYRVPEFIQFTNPDLRRVLDIVTQSVFALNKPDPLGLRKGKAVAMPPELEGMSVTIGRTVYSIGIGGLHSKDEPGAHVPGPDEILRDADVRGYYPNQMLKSGEYPPALGPAFVTEYGDIIVERNTCKDKVGELKKSGVTSGDEYEDAAAGNDGGKIMSNGTFGKTGSPHSVLWAPTMMIQTTLNGQLSLLMLIEWHEHYGIQIKSANTDGIVMLCPKHLVATSDALIKEWEKRTGLEMEFAEYRALYMRDVNNYIAIKTDGEIKRKGEYAPASLIMKKSPDVEICSDAVAEFLANGVPIEFTIAACRDIRKFVTIQNVAGGANKLWGEGPRKNARVMDMVGTLQANGWHKDGRKWRKGDMLTDPTTAYHTCFAPQTPEYLGKVVRWYYSTQAPGPIVYASNGNTVSLSYGARPCMTLPDEFPDDIDYAWYLSKAENILKDIGYYVLT